MTEEQKAPLSPVVSLFFGILAVSSASLLIRFAQKEAPSLVIAAYRLAIAAVILAPFCFRRFKRDIVLTGWRTRSLLALSGIF